MAKTQPTPGPEKRPQVTLDRETLAMARKVAGHLDMHLTDWLNNRVMKQAQLEWEEIEAEIIRQANLKRKNER